jgi:hypothetical protein
MRMHWNLSLSSWTKLSTAVVLHTFDVLNTDFFTSKWRCLGVFPMCLLCRLHKKILHNSSRNATLFPSSICQFMTSKLYLEILVQTLLF